MEPVKAMGLLLCLCMAFVGCVGGPLEVSSECRNNSAYVYIGANQDLKGVKCVAVDWEYINEPSVEIGDLSKDDEAVCRFTLAKETEQPLRFEVWHDGVRRREVCDWQHYPGAGD